MVTHLSTPRHMLKAAVAIAVLASGCGGNPVIGSSNRGADSHTEATTVENAYIVPGFLPGSCAIQVGDAATLNFTVTNNRTIEAERLLAITSAAADAIRMSPDATLQIPPGSSIAAGEPIEQVGPAGPDRPFTVIVHGLHESAKPGTSVDVTFRFEKHGEMTMRVPIEACPTQN